MSTPEKLHQSNSQEQLFQQSYALATRMRQLIAYDGLADMEGVTRSDNITYSFGGHPELFDLTIGASFSLLGKITIKEGKTVEIQTGFTRSNPLDKTGHYTYISSNISKPLFDQKEAFDRIDTLVRDAEEFLESQEAESSEL